MSETRRHPDLFTADEAAEYLHQPGNPRLMDTLREKKLVEGAKVGKELMFHRQELDAAMVNIFFGESIKKEKAQPATGPRLNMRIGGSVL